MKQRYLSYVGVDIVDDGLQVPVRVSSLNNGTALCDSKNRARYTNFECISAQYHTE